MTEAEIREFFYRIEPEYRQPDLWIIGPRALRILTAPRWRLWLSYLGWRI